MPELANLTFVMDKDTDSMISVVKNDMIVMRLYNRSCAKTLGYYPLVINSGNQQLTSRDLRLIADELDKLNNENWDE